MADSRLSHRALEAWKFFRSQDEWIKLFHLVQKNGDADLKRATIRKYAEMVSHDGGPTRVETGILIQHDLKWLDVKAGDPKATDAN